MSSQQCSGSSFNPAGSSSLQSAFSEALEELEVEINQQPTRPEVLVPVPSQTPDELYFQENLPEKELKEPVPIPTVELQVIEDEQISEYDYNCYEREPHAKRNQNVLGLKLVHMQHDLTRNRYPALPKYPDRIDKVFGSYDHWTGPPPHGHCFEQDEVVGQGKTAFCHYLHRRLRLPNLEERSRWLNARRHDEGRTDSGNSSGYQGRS